MAQPSLTQTFDTSLIDLSQEETHQTSFSTTDSAPSEEYLQTASPKVAEPSTTQQRMPTRYVPTVEAYDAWAEVYDSDGNVLQAVDDAELGMGGLMAEFVREVLRGKEDGDELRLVDLGCGTGRNTRVLMGHPTWPGDLKMQVTGIDASTGMLEKAEEKLGSVGGERRMSRLVQHDFLDPRDATLAPVPLPAEEAASPFDGLISTLVLEHFPLRTFFAVVKSLVKPRGIVLVTNMHRNMGMQSQAGFVSQDEHGNAVKVRGTSWIHGTEETAQAAREAGFEILGDVRESSVCESMVEEGVVGERGRKWVGVRVWYGMLLRREN